jgi:hypothetical protein
MTRLAWAQEVGQPCTFGLGLRGTCQVSRYSVSSCSIRVRQNHKMETAPENLASLDYSEG